MYHLIESLSLASDQSLIFAWNQPEALFAVIGFLTTAIFYAGTRLINEKKRCNEMESQLAIMEKALEEFGNLRHQYNNIVQSAVFYIENEHEDAGKDFVTEIMKKTAILNQNNFLQLIKIKNRSIRNLIAQMAAKCDIGRIDLGITVSGEVNQVNVNETALVSALEAIFSASCDEVMGLDKKAIDIEIISEDQGISIIFNRYYDKRSNSSESAGTPSRPPALQALMARHKNIIYNSYIDNDYHRQEIMIM